MLPLPCALPPARPRSSWAREFVSGSFGQGHGEGQEQGVGKNAGTAEPYGAAPPQALVLLELVLLELIVNHKWHLARPSAK